jgi:hypothetical protein
MARLAFIVGSNGPRGPTLNPLKYAKQDARQFAAALRGPRCGFKVTIATNTKDPFMLRRELFGVSESCGPDDTLVIYFSGHGVISAGNLVLLLDNSALDRVLGTAIPCVEFMNALSSSKSQNKLLILDCCNAGTAAGGFKDGVGTPVEELGIKSENHVILMASGHLEAARELKELKGSFLTKTICEGVTKKFEDADKDGDGALSLQDLRRWLEQRAAIHNRNHPNLRVPIPQQFGRGRGDFYLTLPTKWRPIEIKWADGSTMVALPKVEANGRVACIGKFPITNRQYRRFVQEAGYPDPQELPSDDNEDSFRPWRDRRFNSDDQPVVCVSYHDAVQYCRWVSRQLKADKRRYVTKLPTTQVWDLAAFGTEFPSWDPDVWQAEPMWPRSRTRSPFPITSAQSTNQRGIFPMLGNVWEWCAVEWDRYAWDRVPPDLADWEYPGEIRGGSFLEDLRTASEAKLQFDQFSNGIRSRDSDIGFRIASEIPISLFGLLPVRLTPA